MTAIRTFANPAALPPVIVIQAEAMWAYTLHGAPGAFDDTDERLADLLGLGPGDGHDELTRCEYDRCNAWFWADEGGTVAYNSGRQMQMCAAHAVPDDPGARVYPGVGLEAAWRDAEQAAISARIRATGGGVMNDRTDIHHPTGTNDVCTACGQHPDARIHHTPERLAGKHRPAIGEHMLRDPIEQGANLLAAAITPSGHGWAYAARFTKEALRDLIAAGWTPPAREASDEESKLRAELEAAYTRIDGDRQDLDRVQAEAFALSALRDQLVHDVFSLSGRGQVAAALVKADAKERFTRQEVADLLRKVLDRCDRAKDSAARQWEAQRAEWEATTQRNMVALAERFEQGELFAPVPVSARVETVEPAGDWVGAL